MNSVEIDRAVGGEVQEALGFKVDLSAARAHDLDRDHERRRVRVGGQDPGAGGLPVGVTGRGMALLSGGIDSPVAAYRMMRRGLRAGLRAFPRASAGVGGEPREGGRAGGASDAMAGALDA